MKIKNLLGVVENILREYPQSRSNDRYLMWQVWFTQDLTDKRNGSYYMQRVNFLMGAATPESITRCRRKLQERDKKSISDGKLKPKDSLLSSKFVEKLRKEKESTKGGFANVEKVKIF